jgi:hypothetical protein
MKIGKALKFALFSAALILFAPSARAATPTLSLANTGGSSVRVSVTGDSNSSISFYYNSSSGSQFGIQNFILGSTDPNGNFSTTVSAGSYGIIPGSLVYVIVNNQQSAMLTWPSVGTLSPSLSQTNVTVAMGQSAVVTSYGNLNPLYVSNNSNPGVANFTVNGNQITITGTVNGSVNVLVCYQNSSSSCAPLYVTVLQTGNNQLSFSQSSASLVPGQSASISIYGGSGGYFISNNTNPSAIQAVVFGSSLTLTATAYSGASSIITVCSTSFGSCGTLTVTANGSAGLGLGGVTFSQTNPIVTVGQSMTVMLYGGSGTYYFTSTPSSVVQATISGNSLLLYGANSGAVSVSVCSAGGCGTLPVTVTGSLSGTSLTFSPNPVSVYPGQTASVSLYGNGGYYLLGNQPPGVSAYINGAVLTVSTAGYIGAASNVVTICQSGGQCANLTIIAGAGSIYGSSIYGSNAYGNYPYGNYSYGSGGSIYFTPSNPTIFVGQSANVALSGGSGGYYVPTYATANVQASVNGSNLVLYGISPGSSPVSVCSSVGGGCSSLYVTVSGGNTAAAYSYPPNYQASYQSTAASPSMDSLLAQLQQLQQQIADSNANSSYGQTGGSGQFYNFLAVGYAGSEVSALQEFLAQQGFYNGPITGYYGPLTAAAVREYQRVHGLPATGTVDPATRAALNGNAY